MAMDTRAMAKPTFIPPMLATLVGAPFDDPDWLFEVKWDGFRVEAVVDAGTSGSGRAASRTRPVFRAVPRPSDLDRTPSRRSSTAR